MIFSLANNALLSSTHQEPAISSPVNVLRSDTRASQIRGRIAVRSFAPIILLANVSLFMWGCSSLPERLKASQLNDKFIMQAEVGDSNPFAAYIEKYKDIIRKARVDIDSAQKEEIIDANAPFEFRPDSEKCKQRTGFNEYENGILLIHGLTASPYIMQDLGKYFRGRCFLVRAVLLPGHGTRPGDLLDIHYQDWLKAIEYGIQSFNGQVQNLFLSGYSIGGTLAVHHALGQQHAAISTTGRIPRHNQTHGSLPAIKGLFLFSPALKLNSSWAFLAGTASVFSDWMAKRSDRDYAAYESFAYNAAAQSYQLIQETKHRFKAQKSFPVPVFIALSEDDGTVDSKYTIYVFQDYLNNRPNWMQLYTTDPQNYARDPRIEALQSRIEDENIISFSHTSITVPRSHRHYGANGDYHRCVHYREQSKPWLACTSEPGIVQAETSESFLEKHTIRQLTYNAYFSRMLSAMDRFLERLGIPSDSQGGVKAN